MIKAEITAFQKEELYSVPAFFLVIPSRENFMGETRSCLRHRFLEVIHFTLLLNFLEIS